MVNSSNSEFSERVPVINAIVQSKEWEDQSPVCNETVGYEPGLGRQRQCVSRVKEDRDVRQMDPSCKAGMRGDVWVIDTAISSSPRWTVVLEPAIGEDNKATRAWHRSLDAVSVHVSN